MFLFQFGEPAKEPIIFRVADQRIVQDVILVVVFLDLPPQLQDLFFRRWGVLSGMGLALVGDIVQREFLIKRKLSICVGAMKFARRYIDPPW